MKYFDFVNMVQEKAELGSLEESEQIARVRLRTLDKLKVPAHVRGFGKPEQKCH